MCTKKRKESCKQLTKKEREKKKCHPINNVKKKTKVDLISEHFLK